MLLPAGRWISKSSVFPAKLFAVKKNQGENAVFSGRYSALFYLKQLRIDLKKVAGSGGLQGHRSSDSG